MFGRQRHRHNPGRYNLAIILRASSAVRDPGGDVQREWDGATIASRALRRHLTQTEVSLEGGMYSRATDVFEMPWVPGLTVDYRVEIGTALSPPAATPTYHRIIAMRNLEERNRELYVYTVEDEGAKGVGD